MSVASKRSSVSSLIGRFDNNMNLADLENVNKNNDSISINLENNKNSKGNDLDDDDSSIVSNA